MNKLTFAAFRDELEKIAFGFPVTSHLAEQVAQKAAKRGWSAARGAQSWDRLSSSQSPLLRRLNMNRAIEAKPKADVIPINRASLRISPQKPQPIKLTQVHDGTGLHNIDNQMHLRSADL